MASRQVSRESTVTLQGVSDDSTVIMRAISEDSTHNHSGFADNPMDIDTQAVGSKSNRIERSLIVATDFGTTFSSVAYARRNDATDPVVRAIEGYHNDPMKEGRPSLQVPTESWYPNSRDEDFDEVLTADEDSTPLTRRFNNIVDSEPPEDSERPNDELVREDEESIPESTRPRRGTTPFIWGYGIQKVIKPDMDHQKFNSITKSKLLLDQSIHTKDARNALAPVLKRLKRKGKGVIKNDEDVIAHYLTRLFQHAKAQLKEVHEYTEGDIIEHVLCVPAVWTQDACRKMQKAMDIATKEAQFGNADDLFLVSEPEAFAAFVISKGREVNGDECFLVMDAGGGTVDASVYQIKKEYPLRLSVELTTPEGIMNGSSFLNDAFRAHLKRRLVEHKDEIVNLGDCGSTLDGILDHAVVLFENEVKRRVDVTKRNFPVEAISMPGLRDNKAEEFRKNCILLRPYHFKETFQPCLEGIGSLMERQLSEAKLAGYEVNKVILIGGFSASMSLRHYLTERLKRISLKMDSGNPFLVRLTKPVGVPGTCIQPEMAVAYGAILRAWVKAEGPSRISQSNYGFEVADEFDPTRHKAHAGLRPHIDPIDGRAYINGTIDWRIEKGTRVPSHAEYTITVYRVFAASRKTFKCEEILWVSDVDNAKSHYRHRHLMNRGARKAGAVIADMTDLVLAGRFPLITPAPGVQGKPHYKVEFELVMIVNGRNLRYEARWPTGCQVRGTAQICIAAAFRPGTD